MRTRLSCLVLLAAIAFPGIASADLQVTGTFQYEKRPMKNLTRAGLRCWKPLEIRPIRHAQVQVINTATNSVLFDGGTDENGHFIGVISDPPGPTADLVVRCFTHVRPGQFGSQVFNVTDPSSVEYSVSSSSYVGWNVQQPLDIGLVTAHGITLPTGHMDHPFNTLDNLVWMLSYFESQSGYHPYVPLRVAWPTNSSSNNYDVFTHTVNLNAVRGGDNDCVQFHEMGHYLHISYTSEDIFGGWLALHYLDDSNEDPRLAFLEGLATGIEGMIRNFRGEFDPGYYVVCTPTATGASEWGFKFEDGDGVFPVGGAGSEAAITCAVWDMSDTSMSPDGNSVDDDPIDGAFLFQGLLTGEQLLWNVLLQVFPTLPASTAQVFENLWNGCFIPVDWDHQYELNAAFDAWKMPMHNDAWEPDNTPATGTTLSFGVWSPAHTLYSGAGTLGVPGNGDSDYFKFSPTPGVSTSITTSYPDNDCYHVFTDADPYVTVRDPLGNIVNKTDTGGSCGSSSYGEGDRNAGVTFVPISSGVYTVEVKSVSSVRRTGAYQVLWH